MPDASCTSCNAPLDGRGRNRSGLCRRCRIPHESAKGGRVQAGMDDLIRFKAMCREAERRWEEAFARASREVSDAP